MAGRLALCGAVHLGTKFAWNNKSEWAGQNLHDGTKKVNAHTSGNNESNFITLIYVNGKKTCATHFNLAKIVPEFSLTTIYKK